MKLLNGISFVAPLLMASVYGAAITTSPEDHNSTAANTLMARDLDYSFITYNSVNCGDQAFKKDYFGGGIFGSGNTFEGCYDLTWKDGWAPLSAQIVSDGVYVVCTYYSTKCGSSGGAAGQFGSQGAGNVNSGCRSLKFSPLSFQCQRGNGF
ncbi:hypothetical protein TARUN_9250 [Trichoderma arundinaceum]|uniref:Uncharacterized protein n=1 Tax=Trichoderma arundinaceum TaxID=490622 RepID=A0A395NA75_TRIAR|nr:hypothetical protein TARUN_9250 [Trichoderma arundinaceum]